MMTSEKLIQAQVEAYNSRDIEKFIQYYSPEIELFDLPETHSNLQGIDAFRSAFSKLFAENPALHCQIKNRIVMNHFIIDHEWITGAKNHPEGLNAGVIYQVENGLIRRVWFTPV